MFIMLSDRQRERERERESVCVQGKDVGPPFDVPIRWILDFIASSWITGARHTSQSTVKAQNNKHETKHLTKHVQVLYYVLKHFLFIAGILLHLISYCGE